MITEWYNKESSYATQRIRAKTILFGREYYWMTDVDGTWYLSKFDETGRPDFT